jgi:hypothetical protein
MMKNICFNGWICAMPAASGDVLVYRGYKRSIPAELIKGDKSG